MATSADGPIIAMPERIPPAGVRYRSMLSRALRADAQSVRFYPTQQAPFQYSGNRDIFFQLQGTDGFLDLQHTALKLKVRNLSTRGDGAGGSTGASAYIDGSVHSLFNRIRVLGPDGTELERVEKYNKLIAALADIQLTPSSRATQYNALAGYGDTIGTISQEPIIASNAELEYMMPILCGFMQSRRYLPLGLLKGMGIQLQMTLEDPDNALVQVPALPFAAGTKPIANNFQITEVYLVGRVVNFADPVTLQLIEDIAATGQPISWASVSYIFNQTPATAGAVTNNHQFTARARSAKALVSFPEMNSTSLDMAKRFISGDVINGAGFTAAEYNRIFRSISARPSYNINGWQWLIGQQLMPPTQVLALTSNATNDATAAPVGIPQNTSYQEPESVFMLYSCFNAVWSPQISGRITRSNYAVTFGYLNQAISGLNVAFIVGQVGSFVIALDLESDPQDQSVLSSGTDTATNALQLTLRTQTDVATNMPAYLMNHWLMCDVIFSVSGMGNAFVTY